MADLINKEDDLNTGRVKLNRAIKDSDKAKQDAGQAVNISNEAKQIAQAAEDKAENVQEQFNQVVIEGDSSVEAAQARVDADNNTYSTLKERLDTKETQFAAQLAQIENLENYELNSKGRRKQGYVVFISDDFHRGDWEILKPIFEAAGVPFCFAIVTDWMNNPDHPNHNSRGTWEQARYLQNVMGCEAMSHSVNHGRPTPIPDLSEEELRYEYSESKRVIEENGLNCYSYRVPGGNYKKRERVIAREYYRSMVVSERGINKLPIETYELKSIWLDNESFGGAEPFSYYKDYIDQVNEEGGILIISTHGYALNGVESLMEQVVNYAAANSNVVTLNEALNKVGNIVEIGDYSKNEDVEKEGGGRFVVAPNGFVDGGITVAEANQFSSDTSWDEFSLGLTICPITSENANGFPGNGLLFNYKSSDRRFGYNHQEIRLFRSNIVYSRNVDNNGNYTEWELDGKVYMWGRNKGNFNSGINYYNLGITYEEVSSSNNDIDLAPEGRAGVRITHKVTEGSSLGLNYQEYHANFTGAMTIYKRRAISDTEWTPWRKMSDGVVI